MKNDKAKLHEIIEQFSAISNQDERIDLLIDFASKYEFVKALNRSEPFDENNKVNNCLSGVYVWVEKITDDNFDIKFVVKNPQGITAKAFCAILGEGLKLENSKSILSVNDGIIEEIFGNRLSFGKRIGLTNILQYIKNQIRQIEEKSP